MSQLEKLVAKLKARPADATFRDVEKVLEAHGWALRRRESSHATFKKPGDPRVFTVSVVSGTRVKEIYLDKLCKLLGLDD